MDWDTMAKDVQAIDKRLERLLTTLSEAEDDDREQALKVYDEAYAARCAVRRTLGAVCDAQMAAQKAKVHDE